MRKKNKIVSSYMRELKSLLPLHSKTEKQLLHDILHTINDLLNKNDSTISRADLVLIVGEPKEIDARYLSESDIDVLSKSLNIARKVKFLIVSILISVFIVTISRGDIIMIYTKKYKRI